MFSSEIFKYAYLHINDSISFFKKVYVGKHMQALEIMFTISSWRFHEKANNMEHKTDESPLPL